jgi:hypothetical protein
MISGDRSTKSAQEVALPAAATMQRYGRYQIDTEVLLLALLGTAAGWSILTPGTLKGRGKHAHP